MRVPARHRAAGRQQDRSRRRADPQLVVFSNALAEGDHRRSPTSRSSRCSRRSRTSARSASSAIGRREIQLLLNADRLNAYGLTVDQVGTAVDAAEHRDPRRQLHRRPGRVRAAHDGPAARRRGLQEDRARLRRTARSSRSATSAASPTRTRKSAARRGSTARTPISMSIRKQSGTNTVEVVDRVHGAGSSGSSDAAAGHQDQRRHATSRGSSAGRSRTSSCT